MSEDDSDRFDARFRDIAEIIGRGDLVGARSALDTLEHELPVDATRERSQALRLLATMDRMGGDPTGGLEKLDRALDLAGGDGSLLIDIGVEQARCLADQGHHDEALECFRAIESALTTAGADTDPQLWADRTAIGQARADLLVRLDRPAEAARVLHALAEQATAVGDRTLAADLFLLAATNTQSAGDRARALHLLHRAQEAEGTPARDAFVAESELVALTIALTNRRTGDALGHAQRAKDASLRAVMPLQYLTAVLSESRVADATGDRVRAYTALASGLVTIADLLGNEAASSALVPELERLRDSWGAEVFAAVKQQHDDLRRAARTAGDRDDDTATGSVGGR